MAAAEWFGKAQGWQVIAALTFAAMAGPALAQQAGKTAELLLHVNETTNRRFVQVEELANRWAAPDELRASGRGDCEDFAIAKYFALLEAGVPVQRLRIGYALVQLGGGDLWRPHMVLAYLAGDDDTTSQPLILDTLISEIRPASRRPDLRLLFSFGLDGLWVGVDGQRLGAAEDRLDAWRGVLERMSAAGPATTDSTPAQTVVTLPALR